VGEPLIGVEDMDTPRWAEGYAATANAGLRAVAAKAPGTVALAVRWA
jgi:ATP-binding cassette subfamily B protein